MAIFDKELNHLDTNDPASSLRTLENYISYMRERLEFNNSNLTKTLSSTGTSAAEMVLIMAALQNNVQALQSSVTAMQGQIGTLETTVAALNNSVQALQTEVAGVKANVTTLQGTVQNIDQRVTALENEGGST